ncbi:MAG: AsmA family protein [Alphaproteobacteria bacterium]|nr:AsmA family protein [Alphaproteobacteria bacterium]
MLKKVILGIVCFIVLTIAGLGIYIYTLDWNKHKALVAERFSQITGLKAVIDGGLSVELFPTPKFSAKMVKFSKNNSRSPLVEVKEISANVELMPMFNNEFILSSMSLTGASVFLNISEKDELNWSGVGSGGRNKSGNVEVSFNDIRLTSSTIIYDNKKTGDKFEIPNISSNINAKSLEGPYRISGKFIHNNSEINFNGDVVNNKNTTLKMNISNADTSSKFSIDGTIGSKAKGNITFDTKSLFDIVSVIFGENKISDMYTEPFLVSFVYGVDNKQTKLDNFTLKYGKDTAGSGVVNLKKADKWIIDADLDMIMFDLGLLRDISKDVVAKANSQNNKEAENNNSTKYDLNVNIKSNYAKYQNADAQKLMIGVKYADDVINVDRFSVIMPGETYIKSVGKVNLSPKVEYIFNQTVDSKDLRIFASVFGLDIAKYTSQHNKNSVFKRGQAEMMISGDLSSLKVSVSQALVDASTFAGNLGFIFNKDKPIVVVQADVSKVVFDKYFQISNADMKNASLKDKIIYQMSMSPWKGDFETDATLKFGNVVYNNVVIDNLDLHFIADKDKLDVKKLHSTALGGAEVDITASLNNVYVDPYFNELTYSVKTSNFPFFAQAIGIDTGKKGLFKRKIFATQGVLNGSLSDFNLSSIQKFGDVEFSYTGDVGLTDKNVRTVKGNIELKANNFLSFVKNIGFDYTPDIPVTTLTLSGNIEGSSKKFGLSDLSAYLGTNHIVGQFEYDNEKAKPFLKADISFDKFDINRYFNIKKPQSEKNAVNVADFIANPLFSDDKFDLSSFSKLNFNITSNIKKLIWNNEVFNDATFKGSLNDGLLDIANFDAKREDSKVKFDLKLNTNNIAKIEGNYNIEGIKTRGFGGNIYYLDKGTIDAEGNFNSLISSKKEFFENLNSKGKFRLYGTAFTGWDLDIIKFELEQRKSVDGFDEAVMNSLKTGKSYFDEVKGRYEIAKGVIVADNITWSSPVINMSMDFQLNLSDWKFNSNFNALYKNASFSDVLKFSFAGDLSSPEVKSDLTESIQRITSIEENVEKVKASKEKEKNELLSRKIETLISNIRIAQQNIKRMSLDVARYKPLTNNVDVIKVYENNIKDLKLAENKLVEIENRIRKADDEKTLMDLEATLAKETARFMFIPKLLEENYVVDSKYVFDDTFNKITWLFNLAQNNSSYYNSLTEVYMAQIELLKSTENPVDENVVNSIKEEMDIIAGDIEKISKLHSKIRDNYLDIIDTTSISRMKENNGIAEQALSTMFTYVKLLNISLVNNIDSFRTALGITAKDYDAYMVSVPEKIEDIDISMPTTKNGEKTTDKARKSKSTSTDSKKK